MSSVDTTINPANRQNELLTELLTGGVAYPYAIYDELREIDNGVATSDLLGVEVVTRHADVKSIALDHSTFSSDLFWEAGPGIHNAEDAEQRRFAETSSKLFAFRDPPFHTQVRSIFRHAFTPAAIREWEVIAKRVTGELLDACPRDSEFDIMAGFASDMPVALIAEILGVPADMRPHFRDWSYAYASTLDPMVQGAARDQAIATSLELFDYLESVTVERRKNPREDLISTLVHTKTSDGRTLVGPELVAQLGLLLAAGNETTTTSIGNGLSLLFEHPEALAAVRADRSLLPTMVEEILRFEPPLHIVARKTTREVTVGGKDLPSGQVLSLLIPAANRDPRQFSDPSKFDVARRDNKHLTFLQGIHFCIGAPLARMELRVVFDHLLTHFPNIRPGDEPAQRRTTNAVARGWVKRPVVL